MRVEKLLRRTIYTLVGGASSMSSYALYRALRAIHFVHHRYAPLRPIIDSALPFYRYPEELCRISAETTRCELAMRGYTLRLFFSNPFR